MGSSQELVNVIWSIADMLRGDFKQSEYGRIILPLIVVRRLDCLLADTKPEVVARSRFFARKDAGAEAIITEIAGRDFYNTSPLEFAGLLDDPDHISSNLREYIHGFSRNAAEIIESFDFSP